MFIIIVSPKVFIVIFIIIIYSWFTFLKMVIFYSDVSLLEGISHYHPIIHQC